MWELMLSVALVHVPCHQAAGPPAPASKQLLKLQMRVFQFPKDSSEHLLHLPGSKTPVGQRRETALWQAAHWVPSGPTVPAEVTLHQGFPEPPDFKGGPTVRPQAPVLVGKHGFCIQSSLGARCPSLLCVCVWPFL